jgi:hypothetical protein
VPAREALGVDVGGVLIPRVGVEADTTFKSENYLETPEIPDAFDVLRRLVDERFGRRVFIVSKCGPRVQTKTLRWLKHHRFFERTGVKLKHVHFCLARSDKAPICRKLGITHFIDDRLDVLLSLQTVPHRFLFSSESSTRNITATASPSFQPVTCWRGVADALLE